LDEGSSECELLVDFKKGAGCEQTKLFDKTSIKSSEDRVIIFELKTRSKK